jgi:uncharacterized BrkB/YihY/UPF0761 family membrane protein
MSETPSDEHGSGGAPDVAGDPRPESGELSGAPDVPHAGRVAWAKRTTAEARSRLIETQHRLEAARPNNRLVDALFGTYEHDTDIGGGILAGAVAFRVFLLLVPYVFVFVMGFGLFARSTDGSPRTVAMSAGVAGIAAQAMSDSSKTSINAQVISIAIGVFALLIAARTAMKTLRSVHILIWHVPGARRASLLAAVGLVVVVTAGLAVVQLVGALRNISVSVGIAATGLFVAIPAAIWLAASLWYFPKPEPAGWRDLLPGAIVVGLGIEALHLFTVLWISHQVESKSETYGAIGVALALLLWAYLLGRVLTAGVVVNAANWFRTHPPGADAPPSPSL